MEPSLRRCSNSPPCSKSPVRTNEGWKLQWTVPRSRDAYVIHSVVPGPFRQARLLKAVPYVVLTTKASPRDDPLLRLRTGIPDPWLEYLTWREGRAPGNARAASEYVKLTDYVWNERGLPMLQGIPDPWKTGSSNPSPGSICRPTYVQLDEGRRRRRKKATDPGRGDSPMGGKIGEANREEPAKSSSGFERVRRRLEKLDDQLRRRCAELGSKERSGKKSRNDQPRGLEAPTSSREGLERALRGIERRIKVTSDELDSPDMALLGVEDPQPRPATRRRESDGGSGKVVQSFDRREERLFVRRSLRTAGEQRVGESVERRVEGRGGGSDREESVAVEYFSE
ncbi:uncharacterized protein LOC106642142 [Copidosoma floridanum]|uniref:uncharacterized protein LOC106642142 n=1 Tax=Copidosoma floridanum TaxID=29053 RepID=UPI0006C9938C|nr:uncharacterized protein LOC106642142 [Copidosoma floridanum]